MSHYGDDLAYIHDVGFGAVARNAAATLLEQLRKRKVQEGLVIDLGCGSGILACALANAGFDVLGIDLSPAMIELARGRVPTGEFRVGSFLTAQLPSCVAVCAIGECLNYRFDRRNSRRELSKLFRRIYQSLRPEGVLLLDVATPGREVGPGPQRRFQEGEDWAVLVTAEEDRQRGLLTRQITSFRKMGELYRRDREVHQLRLYGKSEVAALLRGAGLRVRLLRGYGSLRFHPGLVGFLARKPS